MTFPEWGVVDPILCLFQSVTFERLYSGYSLGLFFEIKPSFLQGLGLKLLVVVLFVLFWVVITHSLKHLLMTKKSPSSNRKKKKKTSLEQELWKYIADYSRGWVYPDNPRAWSSETSRDLGFADGWLTSIKNKSTSAPLSLVAEVCDSLNRKRLPHAPSITLVTAIAAADRRLRVGGEGSVLCIELPLIDILQLSRDAKAKKTPLNDHVRNILLQKTRSEAIAS